MEGGSVRVNELMNEYEAAVVDMARFDHVTIRGFDSQNCDPRVLFREELLKHDFTTYISKKT